MNSHILVRVTAIGLALAFVAPVTGNAAPAAAATSTTAQSPVSAGTFIDELADKAYGVLRSKKNDKDTIRREFRALLKDNFAITQIGNKLIRRHVRTISRAQYEAYQQAFPDYVVDTYTDNMFEFADSDLRIVRTVPRGTRGNVDVYARVYRDNGAQPIDSIWSVKPKEGGGWLVTDLNVAGVNLSLTQEADFNAFIAKNGFDALVAFMRGRNKAS